MKKLVRKILSRQLSRKMLLVCEAALICLIIGLSVCYAGLKKQGKAGGNRTVAENTVTETAEAETEAETVQEENLTETAGRMPARGADETEAA